MRELLHRFDAIVGHTITDLPAWFHPFFIAITTLGHPIITLLIGFSVAAWGYYQINWRLIASGVVVWMTLGAGSIIKLFVERARPATEYAASLTLDTYSFPSGHTSGSTIAYGLLAYIAWHVLPAPWSYIIIVFFAVLIFLIGISRIYLGAHFPSDVVAGWLLGGCALGLVIWVIRPFI
jgi:undecaprenyl-diphosphatase